jgi:ectoine hydroxylase-related dioxygenase (phytanoyl-CoA dioxygenase family)
VSFRKEASADDTAKKLWPPANEARMPLTASEKRHLDDTGYLVLDGFMTADLLARLRHAVEERYRVEGEAAGAEFKQEPGCRRLANLVDKGTAFHDVIGHARIHDYIRHVLGPAFKLSSLNARSVNPYGAGAQPLHADMAAVADEHGFWVCNTLWMLDDFTSDNGALRIVPGSHRWGRLPQEAMADPYADHPDQVLVTGTAGTVVVVNAHAWHAGTANRTPRPRTAVHGFFCRRDRPQQQYQKYLLRAEVQRELSPALRQLLALDDPENDRLSAEVAVRSGFLK